MRRDSRMHTGSQGELDLVSRAARGDRDAFALLLRRYQRPVVGFAYRYLGNREDAEDAAQDAFIRVYFSLAKLRQPERFSAYLFATALNICRRRARKPRSAPQADATAESPECQTLRQEEHERLLAGIAGLPEDLRAVVSLRAVEELGFAEIGEIVGATEGACRVRYHRARELLKAALGVPAEAAKETA